MITYPPQIVTATTTSYIKFDPKYTVRIHKSVDKGQDDWVRDCVKGGYKIDYDSSSYSIALQADEDYAHYILRWK